MGAGRSGSTILGVALGNCDGVFYAGELDKWLGRSGVSPLAGEQRARFWTTVRDGVDAADLFGGATRCLERSAALLRPRCWPARRRLRARYREVAADLYRAIAREVGATHVVDTSHYPLRARELQRADVDLYLLFTLRDPQSVIASYSRDDVPERGFGVLTTNAYLWLTHLLSAWVFLRHPRERRLLVGHEDLLADPEGVIGQILRHADSDASVPDLDRLSTGLPFQGNRLIRSDVVELERGRPRPRHVSSLTSLLQLPARPLLALLSPAARARAGA
jgi:hypothetical protein